MQLCLYREAFEYKTKRFASEYPSRTDSGEDARNRSSTELVKKLTLRFNRARQQEITREPIEITSFLSERRPEHGYSIGTVRCGSFCFLARSAMFSLRSGRLPWLRSTRRT